MTRHIDIAVVGAGQAGLAMSRTLSDAGVEHVVLERGGVGERWRSERWPSLRLLTPGWMMRLPGLGPVGHDPDSFMPSADFVDLLARYSTASRSPHRVGRGARAAW
jgi:putative flavoprotein involved in K+ transport